MYEYVYVCPKCGFGEIDTIYNYCPGCGNMIDEKFKKNEII